MTLRPCYRILEQGRGAIGAACNKLQDQFRAILPNEGSQLRIDLSFYGGLTARLVNSHYDRTEREFGGEVPIVLLLEGLGRKKPLWLSWTEHWRQGPDRRFVYHASGLTVFSGGRNERVKLQLFHAEWPGVREILDGEPQYEAQGAGHPHWQFDALRSFVRRQQEQMELQKLESVINDSVQTEEFMEAEEDNVATFFNMGEIEDISWTQMHFASLAEWSTAPWDGNVASVRQHARGPEDITEVHNWVISCIRYIGREIIR